MDRTSDRGVDLCSASCQIELEEIALLRTKLVDAIRPGTHFAVEEDDKSITVTAGETVYRVNKLHGWIDSLIDNGREMLTSPIRTTIWRAPTDNDRKIKADWEKAGYKNEQIKAGHIALIALAKNILEQCIYLLGFEAPEKM